MRKRMKKLAVYLMTAVMMLSCISVEGTTVKAEGTYVVNPADYTIEYLLSLYQVYIEGDVTTTNTGHQVGAMVIGGSATLGNSFGNATVAPSYINHIEVFGQTNSYYSSVEQLYGDYLTNQVYYTSKADSVYLTTQPKTFSQVAENTYINFDDAFDSIKDQSAQKAEEAAEVTVENDYITIDLSKTPRKYVITAEQLKAAKAIRFDGTNGNVDVFRDTTNPIEISFTGCDDNDIALNFNGEAGTNEYAIGVQMDDANGNFTNLNNQLKKMTDSAESGQVSAKGMNLLWNFPDATGDITVYYNSGHIVAPQAHVDAEGGNYEGGIIAASAYLNSEGHFYPYYEIGTAQTTGEVTDIPVTKSVKKTWNDDNNRLQNRPTSVTVYLCEMVDGVPVKVEGSEKTLTESGGSWTTADWTGLKAGAEYTVVEEEVPGYTSEVIEDGGVFEVINTPATTSITVTKVWANDGYNVNNTRRDIEATLQFAGGASIDPSYLNGQSDKVTLNDSNNWTYTWTGLPAYKDKQKLSYVATETQYPTGYTPSSSQTGNNVILTNTYMNNVDTSEVVKTEFTVKKEWNTTGDSNPPAEAQVYLVVDGTVDGTAVTLNAGNNWSYTWPDLPKTKTVNGESVEIKYSAKEVVVPEDYTASYSEVVDNSITITNTYTPATSKTVKKIWNDGNSASRPTSIDVQLYADGVAHGDAVTLTASDNWEYTWTNLPELKANSTEEVVYTVKEVSTPVGYECATEIVGDAITLINTLKATEPEPKTGSITLTGTKVVEGTDAPPEEYKFVVKEGDTQVATGSANGAGDITFTEIQYDEDDIGNHTYKITETAGNTANMEYDDTEITVVVTVAEGTDALTATVTSGAGTIAFTNTYTEQVTPTPVTATATFSKTSAASTGELTGAEITLSTTDDIDLSNVTGSGAIDSKSTKSITWTSGSSAMVLSGLPAGDYTMTETTAPMGYKKAEAITFTIDENGDVYKNGTKVTDNKITMVDEAKAGEIDLLGMKNLEGDAAPSETYNFVVKEQSTQVATGSVTGEGVITFTTITYGPEDIGEHTYTITEVVSDTPGMTYDTSSKTVKVTVSDDGEDKLKVTVDPVSSDARTFTNTYDDPTPATTTATFSKTDATTSEEVAGATITITSSNVTDLSTVTKTNGSGGTGYSATTGSITWVSSDSPVVLEGLLPGTYTMKETNAPEGYKYASDITFTITDDGKVTDANGNELTDNKITMVDEAIAKITKKVTKVWDDNNNAANKRPESVQVQLKANGSNEGAAVTLNSDNSWTYTWTDLDKADAQGTTITYTVDEVSVPVDYSKVVTTADNGDVTITNTYPAVTPVTATATFSKTDATTSEEVAGATITITSSNVTDLSTVTKTNGSGGTGYSATTGSITWVSSDSPVVLEGLLPGTYTMKETNAPEGYQYASDITFIITDDSKVTDASGNVLTDSKIIMVDEAKAGSITLTGSKVLAGDTAPDETYNFVVKEGTTQVATGSVDGAGTITFTEITYGPEDIGEHTYTVTETAGSTTGMVYDSTEKTVTVTVSDEGNDTLTATIKSGSDTVSFTNTYTKPTGPLTATATFSKKAVSADGDELAGAEIILTYVGGTNDFLRVTHVSGGEDITIAATSITWTSTETAMTLSGLPAGTYTMKETNAPEGYQYASDITFIITDDGKVTDASGNELTDSKIIMVDEAKAGSITLTGSKVLAGDTAPDETYNFVVKEGTTQVATGSVDGAGTITFTEITYGPEDIGEHTYTVTETAGSTTGMVYDDTAITVKVNVTEGADALSATITSGAGTIKFTNTYTAPTPTTITVDKTIKKDWADVNDADKIRPTSVEVAILENGVATGKTVTLSDNNNWEVKVESLPTTDSSGQTIVYTIEEKSVPTGYTATYSTSGDVLTVTNTHTPTAEDAPATGGLKITVVDEKTNKPVPGATVQIKYPDGTVETKTTDANGEINYPQDPGVPVGEYDITVTEVPKGYTVTTGEKGKATVVENKVAEHVAKIDTATGGLKITVVDEKTNDPVPGATVQIKYPDGTVETKTTDANGEINYPEDPGIPTGDYEITVTDVPEGYTVTTGEKGIVTVAEEKVAEHVAKIDISEDSISKGDEDKDSNEDSDDDSDDGTDSDSRDDDSENKSDDTDNDTDSKSTAKTGDDSPVKPVAVIMLTALALFAIIFFIRRRRDY